MPILSDVTTVIHILTYLVKNNWKGTYIYLFGNIILPTFLRYFRILYDLPTNNKKSGCLFGSIQCACEALKKINSPDEIIFFIFMGGIEGNLMLFTPGLI